MSFGDILGLISPAYGTATNQGIGKALPYMSPAYGILTGEGIGKLFGGNGAGSLGGGLGGLIGALLMGQHPHGGGAPAVPSVPIAKPMGGYSSSNATQFNPLGNGQDQTGPRISPFERAPSVLSNFLGRVG